ncbi:MAG: META domain-containing protein [Tildeniella nuda ZEHNDER 1965/U140]|nr:META domain-containing protein [Tildeniella nuda ZEHNDER 1965/U140]
MKKLLALLLGTGVSFVGFAALATSQPVAWQAGSIAQSGASINQPTPSDLLNTEWLLEDLGGSGVIDNLQTTLSFDSGDRLSGQGGCNRYNAPVKLVGNRLTVSAIASTKKLCPPAVMNQENRYFQALQNAQRFRLEGSYLLIDSQGLEAPLRFTRLTTTSNAETTLVSFQGRRNAVRVFVRDGQTQMNVYDKRVRRTWVIGSPVKTEQTPEGTRYTNARGEAALVVFVPNAGKPPTLTINGRVDR